MAIPRKPPARGRGPRRLDPRQFDALYNLGLTAARAGDRLTARDALKRFVRTAPPARYRTDIAAARRLLLGSTLN